MQTRIIDRDITVITPSGRFDALEVGNFNQHMEDVRTNSPRVIVNLADVLFMDSAALACLVQNMKACRKAGGDLRICNLKQPVRVIFELTRLDKAFTLYESVDDAVASLN